MRKRSTWLVALLAAAGGLHCRQQAPAASSPAATIPLGAPTRTEPIRILPLGDSITQADSDHDSYRRPLWHRLRAEAYEVDFVGSQKTHHRGDPPHDDFDRDHEGHWGWRADEILAEIGPWASAYRPEVALIHLGSNDVFQNQTIESTVSELAAIVERLREANAGVVVLLAEIIPVLDERKNPRIARLNPAVRELAGRLSSERSPVIAVDHFTGFDPARDTYDGVHPNASGEEKMAGRWLEALRQVLPPARSSRSSLASGPWLAVGSTTARTENAGGSHESDLRLPVRGSGRFPAPGLPARPR